LHALMLAAGIGSRLSGNNDTHSPKALLRFDGKSLLRRHVETLRDYGVEEMTIVVGYHRNEIAAEIDAIGAGSFVRTVYNPEFRRGSAMSLWTARNVLAGGDSVLFMDADVLYHPLLIGRLANSAHGNCFLLDSEFRSAEQPVKLCLRGGVPVEFRKAIDGVYDVVGEWPGFLRLSPTIGRRVAEVLEAYVAAGRLDEPYEEAIRDVMLSEPPGAFAVEDITDLPWIEIDTPADLARARAEIMPRLRAAEPPLREAADRDRYVAE